MKKGYLFISNSTKPTPEKMDSLDPVGPSSFTSSSFWAAHEMGWDIYMGINRNRPEKIKSLVYDIKFYNQHIFRNIFAFKDNLIAYINLCRYLKDNPQIEILHCNTPIGGVVGRLAGKKFRKKVIYTAHGFHFYKGAPLFNRTILKWIEKWLARYTDILITINQEDFESAQAFKLKKGGKVLKIPGVGVPTDKYVPLKEKKTILQILNIPEESFICICMGDLVKRKNYLTSINAIALSQIDNIHFIVCGIGPELDYLKYISEKLGISERIHFLGFRTDIKELLSISDVFLFSSLQEGLPRSTMEAMAAGLPCVISDIRGNRDLIENGKGGYLINPNDAESFSNAIIKLKNNPELRKSMSTWNLDRINGFSFDVVGRKLKEIFLDL